MSNVVAKLWNSVSSLWEPSGQIRFIVGAKELPEDDLTEDNLVDAFDFDVKDELPAPSHGEQQKTFVVHSDVLLELSPVVRAAITGEFKEAACQKMELPQFNPDDFELFLRLAQSVAFSKILFLSSVSKFA